MLAAQLCPVAEMIMISPLDFASFVFADWGKDAAKRAAWVADVASRNVRPLPHRQWSLPALLEVARERRGQGPVLIAIDAVLGVPTAYWQAARSIPRWRRCRHFLDLLALVTDEDAFWSTARSAEEWRVDRPFHAVPAGQGSRSAFDAQAGFALLRRTDQLCGAKPPFCVSGIPGTVGSGTRALWRELAPLLRGPRDFSVWPFEGPLASLPRADAIVLAEAYPGIAYTIALEEDSRSALLKVSKTKRRIRDAALERLLSMRWLHERGVSLEGLPAAQVSEDDFDALFGAAALLRRAVDGAAIDDPDSDDPIAEGGILLTSAIDFSAPRRRFDGPVGPRVSSHSTAAAGPRTLSRPVPAPRSTPSTDKWTCPISGCGKVFANGRSGWDAHVASHRTHPAWHLDIRDPEARKARFLRDFPDWCADR